MPQVIGTEVAGDAVFGQSESGRGAVGTSVSATGVEGNSNLGTGVFGISVSGRGVVGVATDVTAVEGNSTNGTGVFGTSVSGRGVVGVASDATGVEGNSTSGVGVFGSSQVGIGVFGVGPTAARFEGVVEVTGDIRLLNADCAENFDVATDADTQAGTVLVLQADGRLAPCDRAYDSRVVGVVSGAGSFRPALILDSGTSGNSRRPVALLGKVCCWVDADLAPVAVGDLLTTAHTTGHAMKVLERSEAVGAVLGKALQPLPAGRGLIAILVTLQ